MSVTQYIGSRYVPLFSEPLDWDNTREYEPLTIVYYGGNSYTSRQAVPKGIDISNNEYWALTGNYNAQIELYRKESNQALDSITKIDNILKEGFVTPEMFGAVGDGITDDTDAIQKMVAASNKCLFINKTYLCKEIILNNGESYYIVGDNATIVNNNNINNISSASKTGFYSLTNRNRNYGLVKADYIYIAGITFNFNRSKDIPYIGSKTSTDFKEYGTNVCLHYYENVIIDNCTFINSLQDELSTNGCGNIFITNSTFNNTGCFEITSRNYGGTNNHCTFYRYSYNDITAIQEHCELNHIFVSNCHFNYCRDEVMRIDEYHCVEISNNTINNVYQHVFENFFDEIPADITQTFNNNNITNVASAVYTINGPLNNDTTTLNVDFSNNVIKFGNISRTFYAGPTFVGSWWGNAKLFNVNVSNNVVECTNSANTTNNDYGLFQFNATSATMDNNYVVVDNTNKSISYLIKTLNHAVIKNNTFTGNATVPAIVMSLSKNNSVCNNEILTPSENMLLLGDDNQTLIMCDGNISNAKTMFFIDRVTEAAIIYITNNIQLSGNSFIYKNSRLGFLNITGNYATNLGTLNYGAITKYVAANNSWE